MNREILFKAKRIDNGEWVEGNLLQTTAVSLKSFIVPTSCYTFDKWDWAEWLHIDTDTICQYTGLTDKDGNKIWENDIVKYPDCEMSTEAGYGDCFENVGSVQWDAESMSFFFTDRVTVDMGDIIINDEVEVIGNIFDNPEFLEGGADE